MDNKYYENVIEEMQPFFEEFDFKKQKNGNFANEKMIVSVEYNNPRQMYTLSIANVNTENSEKLQFKEINAWLFDDSQTADDAVSVGMDFVNSLKKELGIKSKRNLRTAYELPVASKDGNMLISGFTKKMLDVFPVLKEEYKNHISTYENYLYLTFFGENLVPLMKDLFANGTKKQIKKFYDVFELAYVKGDRDTVNILIALLCAASYKDEKINTVIKEMLVDNTHFLTSYISFIPNFAKNKKLVSTLIK